MSSKAAAARLNGAKANGPTTEEGKARSAQNSLKHGLTSSRVVLPHESQEAYDKLEASFRNRFKPADELETELVQEMAAARWRLRRIESMESALFKKAIKQQHEARGADADESEIQAEAYAEVAGSKPYSILVRHAAQLRRAYEKAWRELELIQEQRLNDENEEEDDDEYGEIQNEPSGRMSDRDIERRIHAIMAMPLPRPSQAPHGGIDDIE